MLCPAIHAQDEVLDPAFAEEILRYALDDEAAFEPSRVGDATYDATIRSSLIRRDGLGRLRPRFEAAMSDALSQVCVGVGVEPFVPDRLEIELVAHADGGFFGRHRDTFVGSDKGLSGFRRVVSGVVYLHRMPKPFEGGEIDFYAFDTDAVCRTVEPSHNRLVAFPAFAEHQVRPVWRLAPEFAASRFSVNCWFCRKAGDESGRS